MTLIMALKNLILGPLIKLIVKYPGVMKSRLFLKIMETSPAKISKTYDQKIAESGHEYEAALEKGLNRLPVNPRQALDSATGTGFAAFKIAEAFPDALIDGVDQAEEMIRLAREKARDKETQNIHFNTGNALALDYPANKFDLIVTSNAPVYLDEAARLLKPGGYILVTFSFLGKAILKAQKEIAGLLEKNGFKLIEVEVAEKGAYILGQKE